MHFDSRALGLGEPGGEGASRGLRFPGGRDCANRRSFWRRGLFWLTFTSVSAGMLSVLTAEEPGAAPFSLETQFGKSERLEFPRDKVVLLTIADRQGSAQLAGWVKPVADRYLGRVDIVGVATVGSVPKSLRGLVRSMFRKGSAYPILLDWEGPVSHQYSARRGLANLFLIDRNGTIRSRHHGPASDAAVQQLLAEIERLLDPTQP